MAGDVVAADEPHLAGLQVNNNTTFEDWRHPRFLEAVSVERRIVHGRKIGVVNGVFDLFHLGHLNLIAQASNQQVDNLYIMLVALLNSDASAARLKGPRRPYVPLAARLQMVASQRFVRAAAGFAEETPEEALAVIKPDFLFKGAEYKDRVIRGAEHCGKVVFLPETPYFRTTELEQRIITAAGGSVKPPRTGTQNPPR